MIIYYMKLQPLYIAATARVNRDITLGPAGPVVPLFPSSPTSPYRQKVRKLMTNNHRTKSKNLSTVLSEVQTYTTSQILYYFLWKGEKLKKKPVTQTSPFMYRAKKKKEKKNSYPLPEWEHC